MKKFFATLLALCMVLGMLPATALAEDAEPQTEAPAEQVVNETETDSVIDTEVELKTALAADGTVTLGGDITLTETLTIPAGKTVTLDLAGCKVSYTAAAAAASALITNNGTLTISDSSDAKTGAITYTAANPDGSDIPSYATNLINNYGTLTINGGTLTNATNPAGPACYVVDNYAGTLTINGGTLTTGSYAVRQGAYQPSKSNNVIITDGTLSGYRAVWVQLPQNNSTLVPDVNLTITGGTLTSTDTNYNSAIYVRTEGMSYAGTDITIGGGTFNGAVALSGGNYAAAGKTENVTITGGTFDCSTNYAPLYSYNESFGGVVSGGTFKKAIDQKYLASGYAYDSATGKVAIDTENLIFEASIDGVGHTTLAEAIAAAQPGNTVKLLKDVTISEKLSITKNLTIDGNSKTLTYTGADRAIDIPNNADSKIDVTITDLTVAFDTGYSQRGINYNDDGTLNLTNVTVSGGTIVTYAVNLPGSSDNATVNITNSTLTGHIALNIWGENATINVNKSALTSIDDTEAENYSAVALNNDGGSNVANGTVVTITEGSITALDEKGAPSGAIRNDTETGTVTVSNSTVVNGTSASMVTIVTYSGTDNFYGHATLQGSIDKATDDSTATVKLLKNIELTETVTVEGAVKLNLNEKTLTGTITLATSGATLTTAASDLTVTTSVENSAVVYADGAYKVVPTYTVSMTGQGAENASGSGSYVAGATVTIYPSTKTGYTFAGWTSEDGVTFADASSATTTFTMPAKNVTVTATWTVNQYTITFKTGYGDNATIAEITQDYGTAVSAPSNPSRGGYYYFNGWDKTVPTTMPAENVTITATWYYDEPYYEPVVPVTPPTTTEKTENKDGSTTTTVTDNKTGTVTETTENVDGSTTTVETQKDGTVTEKVENTDGSTQVTETKSETTTNKDGSTTTTTATKTESTDASGATVTETKTEEKVETETGSVTTSTTEVKSEDKTEVTETKAETTVKEDGTTETKTESTTTATDAAGNVTTSTTTATETTTVKEDGATVTEKVEETKSESAEATVETKTTATTTATEEKTETVAVTEETVTKTDGTTETKTTTTTETALADGTTGTAVTDETGKTEATVTISEEAAASEEPVALPIPAVTTTTESEAASTITVTTNSETDTTVAIPVAEVNTSTVAVIVNEDGSETVITETKMTDEGLVIDVPDGATVKIVDNSTDFHDVEDHHWEEDAVDFASARGLVNGVGNNLFDKDGITTRAHVVTLLARLAGVDTTPDEGETWYDKGHDWAVENGITYAGNMNGAITRHEMMTLLWRYMGSPESDHDISHFTDIDGLTAVTEPAARWAVEIGLVGGHGNGTMTPTDNVTRGQLAQFMMNFVQKT